MDVRYKILNDKVGKQWPLPEYATDGSAAMDLRACLEYPTIVFPNTSILVGTGVSFDFSNSGHVGIVSPRSGLGHHHGIVLGNLSGVIDSDYQGEIFVSVWNRKETSYTINPGDKIAQIMFIPVSHATLVEVEAFNSVTTRGTGGFGSTGVS